VVIAAIALTISAWQGFLFRKHNQLSVRPLLDIEIGARKDYEGKVATINLKNDGLGPAIINNCKVTLDGKPLTFETYSQLIEDLSASRRFDFKILPKGVIIRPGESVLIFYLKEQNISYGVIEKNREGYKKFLSVLVQVQYQSMYEENLYFEKSMREVFPDLAKKWSLIDYAFEKESLAKLI